MSESLLNPTNLDASLADFLDAGHWYVGLSGGMDSCVLLHLLLAWRRGREDAPLLSAIHVNHGIQDAAGDWQARCEKLCADWGVPLACRTVDAAGFGSGEAGAREARYRVFSELVEPGAVLFLGHHQDDQVETFFLRLMRGAGVDGLAAIPRTRPLGESLLARPLLTVPRSSIEHYAAHHGIAFVEDPSNSDTAIDRNFLRSELLPLLASRWPSYRRTVTRASSLMATTTEVLKEKIGAPDTVYSVMGDPGLELSELVSVAAEIAALRLRAWLQLGGYALPDQVALDEFLRQLKVAHEGAAPRLECRAYTLQRYREAVYLLPESAPGNSPEPLYLAAGEFLDVPGWGLVGLVPAIAGGFLLTPRDHPYLARRQGGERCRPRGRSAGTSLKKLLQEWGVPPWWRDRIPLLYLDSELLAVGHLAQCETSRWRAAAPPGEQLWCLRWERAAGAAGD